MTKIKSYITIKGNKEGLAFWFDETCSFDKLLEELSFKLETSHQQILSGPLIHIQLKLGKRVVPEVDRAAIRAKFSGKDNLLIDRFECELPDEEKVNNLTVMQGVVRSGQTVKHDGNLLYIGDVNPGGTIHCKGHLFIMGRLRGTAHAGSEGYEQAVIAASSMQPTQLRIASVISRPPDEWSETSGGEMEYAYLIDGVMKIDKLAHLYKTRPDISKLRGV